MTLDPVRLQTLALARAQTSSKPMTAAAIAKDLERFAPASGPEWREAVAAALAALKGQGVIDDKHRVLDREALAKRLEGSGKRKWQQLVERLVPALGLGIAGKDAFAKQILDGRDGWAAAIAGRALSLWTAGPPPTASALRDLLVWRRLGLPGKPKSLPDEVRAHFLQLELDTTPSPSDRLLRILAARALDVQPSDLKVWRNALGQRWLTRRELGGATSDAAPQPASAAAAPAAAAPAPPAAAAAAPSFAAALRRAALAVPLEGRFGERKIFLAAVWDELRRAPAWQELSLADFKARVLAAHRAGEVSLARADLVGAMSPQLVERSEVTTAAGDAVHFLLRPEPGPEAADEPADEPAAEEV